MHDTCEDTGIPIETKISEGPCTKLTFLGIEIDSVAMEMRLPDTKLAKLRECLATWQGKKACKKKRVFLSIIGSLSHACKVVKHGRSFLRRLIYLAKLIKEPDHYVRLNREGRSDIEWWFQFSAR